MISLKNPLKGEMNGYKFSVKPKSLLARKVDKELREELKQWQEENNKEYMEYLKKNEEEFNAALKNRDYTADVITEAPDGKDWMEDAEFRAKRWKKMAEHCMEFDKNPPAKLWESEELEYGMVEMAWDFFTGKREIPMDMLIR